MDYRTDILLCLDVSSSMKRIVEYIKFSFADDFWRDFREALAAASKTVPSVRIKIITFGVASQEGNKDLMVSPWFNISNQRGLEQEYFKASLRRVSCSSSIGKTSALGALDIAFHQDWVQEGDRRRHVICLLSNNSSEILELIKEEDSLKIQVESSNLEELGELWMTPTEGKQSQTTNLHQSAKRLVVFAPQMYPWPEIYEAWDQVIYNPMTDDVLINSNLYEDIISSIVSSV